MQFTSEEVQRGRLTNNAGDFCTDIGIGETGRDIEYALPRLSAFGHAALAAIGGDADLGRPRCFNLRLDIEGREAGDGHLGGLGVCPAGGPAGWLSER
mmetsp:Transcript_54352/g.90190  ORF Transcript_54352/g.90190 Transcript_54352/m.90190 type:complete len:98 (-) Transcript_54352:240-533(-)